ncbi:septal ring lytic transglycosylase RlpA family protein [Pseudomonas turukhanskensis]|uniref:Endolytic peptidoglycan transglycosylase RlpA n=1 Tax=Pseudomonas turukhanskensis TaxID=1806536 RepID=A0A9W6K7P8_9PSED|nr:septal ring lytic transglycosylase RlpA family protein [Pseudomonas turukhanskensis]GLK89240.1 rplA family protein [Pseudomonas turukhanskensis]
MWRVLLAGSFLALLSACTTPSFRTTPSDDNDHERYSGHYNESGEASYYGAKHQGKKTASGERFDQAQLTAAHRTLPFGTRVQVTNLDNNKTVVVRINDRGPFNRKRLIDISKSAAEQLDMLKAGTAPVRVQSLD